MVSRASFLPLSDLSQAGFGPDGELLVGTYSKPNFQMFNFNEMKYTLTWEKPIPEGLDFGWLKVITKDKIILSEYDFSSEFTCIFDKNFKRIKTFQHQSGVRERLLGIGLNDDIFYGRKEGNMQSIIVRSMNTHKVVRSYDTVIGTEERDQFRIGVHPNSSRFAITAIHNGSGWLNIYNAQGMFYL